MVSGLQLEGNQEGKAPLRTSRIFVVSVSAVCLALLVWGGLKVYQYVQPFDEAHLSGTLFLTLAKSGDRAADLYSFDVQSRSFTEVFPNNGLIEYTGKVSADGEKIAYASAPLGRDSQFYLPSNEFLQIGVYDKKTEETHQLTDTKNLSKRISQWSPDGTKIAYSEQVIDTVVGSFSDFSEPNRWEVEVVDVNGAIEHIDNGIQPLWSPDGQRLLYLKHDGLYLYTLSTKQSVKVYALDEERAATNMKLGISRDGLRLAWSVPSQHALVIFKISSWDSFSMKKETRLDFPGQFVFWPVFSPDGRYLVFQRAETVAGSTTLGNAHLVAYDFRAEKYLELTDLSQYNFDFAFIDDWR